MIDPKSKLFVFHDDNASFTDHSSKAADYTRDTFSLDLSSTEDYLYIGFTKPFSSVYAELTTANLNANTLTAEIYDGSSFTAISLDDESEGLTRSGFLFWDSASMKSTTIDGQAAFWIRLRPSADHSATTVRGLNVVFSDDTLLKQEFFEVDDEQILPPGETSHIMTHVAVRNRIMQKLRNTGYVKWVNGDSTTPRKVKLDQWDILDLFEFRQAATYMALSKIYFNLSDGTDDNWIAKHREYEDLAEEQFALALSTIDEDNDGLVDGNENQAVNPSRRLVY